MSAQELLQGVCHSGTAASFPWHWGCSLSGFSTGMCHGHHGSAVVTYSSVGGMRDIQVLCSSVIPNCSRLNYLLLLFSSSHFLPLPASSFSSRVPISLHQLACLPWDTFSFGCWARAAQDTMQLLSTLFTVSEIRFSPLN